VYLPIDQSVCAERTASKYATVTAGQRHSFCACPRNQFYSSDLNA